MVCASSTCSPSRRGFTIVELLVVISIIALLVSLLLPSLGTARAVARSLVCNSNARQIAIGECAYIADNKDLIPQYWEEPWVLPMYQNNQGQGAYTGMWVLLYGHYIDFTPGDYQTTWWNPYHNETVANQNLCKAFRCPDGLNTFNFNDWGTDPTIKLATTRYGGNNNITPVIIQAGMDGMAVGRAGGNNATASGDNTLGVAYTYLTDYMANGSTCLGTSTVLDGYPTTYTKPFAPLCPNGWPSASSTNITLSRVKSPAATWMIIEGCASIGGAFPQEFPTYRHPNLSATFSYMDAHVQSLNPSQMIGARQTSNAQPAFCYTNIANWDPRCGTGY
jgi:prepilin-type N-terminal cleavage/methylation domain-containing protein